MNGDTNVHHKDELDCHIRDCVSFHGDIMDRKQKGEIDVSADFSVFWRNHCKGSHCSSTNPCCKGGSPCRRR